MMLPVFFYGGGVVVEKRYDIEEWATASAAGCSIAPEVFLPCCSEFANGAHAVFQSLSFALGEAFFRLTTVSDRFEFSRIAPDAA